MARLPVINIDEATVYFGIEYLTKPVNIVTFYRARRHLHVKRIKNS